MAAISAATRISWGSRDALCHSVVGEVVVEAVAEAAGAACELLVVAG